MDPVTNETIERALDEVGIVSGDTIMLHGDAGVASQMVGGTGAERINSIVDTFIRVVGDRGTVIVPTFSYSFCKGEPFDVRAARSDVGLFSEVARVRGDAFRSHDPIFSVVAFGARGGEVRGLHSPSCFGAGSIFDRLYEWNGKIVCLGCSFSRATFVHWVEERLGVPYRYQKEFAGEIVDEQGERRACTISYFVRGLELNFVTDLRRLQEHLTAAGKLQSAPVGRFGVIATSARSFLEGAQELLALDGRALIRSTRDDEV